MCGHAIQHCMHGEKTAKPDAIFYIFTSTKKVISFTTSGEIEPRDENYLQNHHQQIIHCGGDPKSQQCTPFFG